MRSKLSSPIIIVFFTFIIYTLFLLGGILNLLFLKRPAWHYQKNASSIEKFSTSVTADMKSLNISESSTEEFIDGSVEKVLKFINIGDWGNASSTDMDIFTAIEKHYINTRFEHVITNGDNNYGNEQSFDSYMKKVFGSLLSSGVKFHFSLGNHDVANRDVMVQQINNDQYGEWDCHECLIKPPEASGKRYYSFWEVPVRFIMLDSNLLLLGDQAQDFWMSQEISASAKEGESWQIVVMHHPVFSSAQSHGNTNGFPELFQERFMKLGVDVVFSGHDHVYERIKSSKDCGNNVLYIVNGAIRLRYDDIRSESLCTAQHWDLSPAFLYVEASEDTLYGKVFTKDYAIVDEWKLLKH